MEYRALGKTGIQLSVLGFGAAPLGGAYGDIDEQESTLAVHTAIDQGINYFDVAPYYGITRAETVLGKALRGIPRDRYYLSTKVGRYGVDEFDFSAQRVIQSVDESLARLGLEYIDIIICHDIEFVSLDQVIHETIPALRKVQDSGKVRFIGVSGLPLKIFTQVPDQIDLDLILSYCHFSLNDTSLSSIIPYLKDKQVGIINASPLSMGLLTQSGPPAWHPASEAIKAHCAKAAAYCSDKGGDLAKLALQFSLSQQDFTSTLVGMSTPAQVVSNIQHLSTPIDSQLLGQVQSILQPVHNRTWRSGLLENNDI